MAHADDEECPSCQECSGCGGGDGSTPKNSHLQIRPGVVHLICSDCDGRGFVCPNLAP